eukprot:CAMPEP_0194486552 /NCGR_PEP_ID=MMETSP0253-20130528/7150_1 /TAXON_ID=2966 /ORGANISM="Noctiluca scintillans" /LENGTH=43 /DNA_ID= /DNA_START= /DNA_END= /DNA_ORIENTATION=
MTPVPASGGRALRNGVARGRFRELLWRASTVMPADGRSMQSAL